MPLQLFVLGPAFGCPSIDAECSAAIALLRLCSTLEWTLTSTHSNVETLPLLIDGDRKFNGFTSIRRHLVSEALRADDMAMMALIQSRASDLISAYLYLSYENYSTATRPAFTSILPLYARFLVPGAIRAAAKENTKHLGISNLDVEALDDKHSSSGHGTGVADTTFEVTAKDRASLLLPKMNTVRSLLAQQPEHAAAFKLRGLADSFLEPLQDRLGGQEYLDGNEKPGSLDALVYGYLGLMLKPKVPRPWLVNIIREHYPEIQKYFERLEDVLDMGLDLQRLPWTTHSTITSQGVVTDLILFVQRQATMLSSTAVVPNKMASPGLIRYLPAMLVGLGSAVVAGSIWTVIPLLTARRGAEIQIFGEQQAPDLSHLSSALSGLSFTISPPPQHDFEPHIVDSDELPVNVGIEIES